MEVNDQWQCGMASTADQSQWDDGTTDQSQWDVERIADQSLWEELKTKLCDELTPSDIKEALHLMPKGICPDLGPLWTMEDPCVLLTFLENNMPETEAVQILENILSVMHLHGDHGSYDFVKRIETCQQEVGRLRRESKVFRDEYFVGRNEEIKSVLNVVAGNSNCKGGMGKTVLALEVCCRLRYLDANVDIINVNLKGRTSVSELLRSILTNVDEPTSISDQEQLEQILLTSIGNITNDTVLLLDNMEDVYEDNIDTINQFINTILEFVETREIALRLVITSRIGVKSIAGESLPNSRIYEVEVGPLSTEASVLLLKKCIKPFRLSPDNSQQVVHICGRCPLAIRLVSNQLRQISMSPDSSHCLSDRDIGDFVMHIKSTAMTGMDNCIEYAITRLDKDTQRFCKMLTIFQTSRFGPEVICVS